MSNNYLKLKITGHICWSPLLNRPAFLSQVFQIFINVPSASAPKQRIHCFCLHLLAPFSSSASSIFKTHPQSDLFYLLRYCHYVPKTVTSYLLPCFYSCSHITVFKSDQIPCLLKTCQQLPVALSTGRPCPPGSPSGPSLFPASPLSSLPLLVLLHPHCWLPFSSLSTPSMGLPQRLCRDSSLCLKHCSLNLKVSSFLSRLLVHLVTAHISARMSPLQVTCDHPD